MQPMQSQEEMHQKIQHSEVPADPRASYPFLVWMHWNDGILPASILAHTKSLK